MGIPRGAVAVFLTCAVAWGVTFLTHGWVFWVLLVISILITYYVLGGWIYHNASPWRRIYFPLIQQYSFLAGAHAGIAEQTGQTFTPRGPVAALLKQIQPGFTEGEVTYLLDKWECELRNGGDQDLLTQIMQDNKVPPQDIPARLERIMKRMNEPENYNAFFIRYAIGETIEAKVGRKEKKSYWKALLEGKIS